MKNKPAAKSNPKLTKAHVEALKPKEKNFIVWDSQLQGFGVRIFPSGQKIFVADYHAQGHRRRMRIGSFGILTVDQAREAARQILAKAALGDDVLEERREAQKTMTLSEFWPQFLEVARLRWKPSTRKLNEYVWGHCLEPGLGKMHLDRIRPGHITHWQSEHKDAPGQANVAFRLLKAMLNHAIRLELIEKNPTNAVKPFREVKRERFLSSEETKRLFDAIAAEEVAGGVKSTARAGQSTGRGGRGKKEAESRGITSFQASLFRLLALTGARLSEISTCEWSWIDRERSVIRLPDSKTGQKTVWLSSKALEEIERLWHLRTQNRYLIEGDKPGTHLVNAHKAWRRVRERAGLLDITIHTLRHNFASHGVMGSIGLSIVGAALGHRDNRTTSRYAHLADNPVAEAVELISGKIIEAARTGGARVLPIEEKKAQGEGQ
jgi:integrase